MENYSLYFLWVSDVACPNLIWSKRFCCKLLFLVHFVFLFCAYRSIELRVKYPPLLLKKREVLFLSRMGEGRRLELYVCIERGPNGYIYKRRPPNPIL